jgi:DNA-binding PucR family transcriptional regulator
MPRVLERSDLSAAARSAPVDAAPPAEPVSATEAIAGWQRASSEVVTSALRVVALAADAEICCLLWPDPAQADAGALRAIDVGPTPSTDDERQSWMRDAQSADAADPSAISSIAVAPVRGPSGEITGCVAMRARADASAARAGRTRKLAREASRHLQQLLSSSHAHTARSSAYEALVEIGTQIQAVEVKSDAIFALIVERAGELLRSDVAWLAMVDRTGDRLRMKVTSGTTTPDFMRMEVLVGTGIGGVALKQRRPVAVRDSTVYRNGMPRSVHRALDDEGVISILCAPLLKDGRMLGALYVGSRTPRDFGEEEAVLLSALAAQAAVTIENARLYVELSEKNDALERAFTVHRMLTDASLAGVGLERLTLQLAQVADRDLVLELAGVAPRTMRYPRHPAATAPIPVAAGDLDHEPAGEPIEIMAGETRLGSLFPLGGSELSALQRKALEHGATVIALELVKEKAALEVEWRLQGELLEELLREGGDPSADVLARAERFGVDVSQPHRVAAMQPLDGTSPEELLEFVRRSLRFRGGIEGLVAQRGELVIAAFGEGGDNCERRRPRARETIEALQQRSSRTGLAFACGLSDARTNLGIALREARGALALAARRAGRGTLVTYDDLGALRFMIDAPDTSEMVAMVTDVLGALAAHDERRNSELLLTLRAYLDTGGHHPKTAERCHIHVSTLKYRLSRIAELVGRPITDPRVRFELSLAYEVLDVLDVIGSVPFGPGVRRRPT